MTEAYVTSEHLERILRLAGDGMILVGGQALAFWAAYYEVPAPRIAKKDLPGGDYINIDVMFRVCGSVATEAIASRAVPAENAAGSFRVMHPMDVLQGRLENVYGLSEKQDEHGLAQLELAIGMTRLFLLDIASQESNRARPVVLSHLSRIETMALSDAGRKVARRHKLHVADAIDPAPVAHIKSFVAKKLPQLGKLMSPARRAELGLSV